MVSNVYSDSLGNLYTTSEVAYNEYKSKGKTIYNLTTVLGFGNKFLSLYTLWSIFFDGGITNDTEMSDMLIQGIIEDKNYTYCFVNGNDVCWFRLSDKKIIIHGDFTLIDSSLYNEGTSLKRLNYLLVKSGSSLKNISYYKWGYSFIENYYKCMSIEDLFSNIHGIDTASLSSIIERLRVSEYCGYGINSLVSCMSDNFLALGLKDGNGHIITRDYYLKDYSVCKGRFSGKEVTYGIILDCEGVSDCDGSLQNGCREVGGIIFSELNGKMFSVHQFIADSRLLSEVLVNVVETYRDVIDRLEPKTGIPTYVYGASDKIMLENQISSISSKKIRKFLGNKFNFIDVKHYVNSYVGNMVDKRTLQNIARELGVLAVRPKHNALSDARTLFNIIAEISKKRRCFNVKEQEVKSNSR